MGEHLGNILLYSAGGIFIVSYLISWILLLAITLLQSILPKQGDKLEEILQKTRKPLGFIQNKSLWAFAILLAVRFIAELLGWAPHLMLN